MARKKREAEDPAWVQMRETVKEEALHYVGAMLATMDDEEREEAVWVLVALGAGPALWPHLPESVSMYEIENARALVRRPEMDTLANRLRYLMHGTTRPMPQMPSHLRLLWDDVEEDAEEAGHPEGEGKER